MVNDQAGSDAFWKTWVDAGKEDAAHKTLIGLVWKDRELYLGGLYVGEVFCIRQQSDRWRGRFMSNAEGCIIGDFNTEYDAREAVESALRRILMQ